jgi:hypothetical protein
MLLQHILSLTGVYVLISERMLNTGVRENDYYG